MNKPVNKRLHYGTGPKAQLSVCWPVCLALCSHVIHTYGRLCSSQNSLGERGQQSHPHFTGGETEAPGRWPDSPSLTSQ